MKNLSIFEPQIEKHHAYKKNMYLKSIHLYIDWNRPSITSQSSTSDFRDFCLFFFKKIRKNSIKLKKVKNSKFRFLWIFCTFFLHILAKFQDSSFTVAQVISQNVILNKSHFCKKWHFLSKFAQFWPKFSKFFIFKIFCVILFMICIFVTILVLSTSILTIL